MICHFYLKVKKKQLRYYTKSDYAYFNLFSDSQDWLVKGTTGHGIRNHRDRPSKVPILNCYQIDNEFYEALETLCDDTANNPELGIIFNKRELRRCFGEENVRDVELWDHQKPRPSVDKSWQYDIRTKRTALWPFNYCKVVRIEIPHSRFYGLPIKAIPRSAIMGLLVKQEGFEEEELSKLLRIKKWEEIEDFEFFPLL